MLERKATLRKKKSAKRFKSEDIEKIRNHIVKLISTENDKDVLRLIEDILYRLIPVLNDLSGGIIKLGDLVNSVGHLPTPQEFKVNNNFLYKFRFLYVICLPMDLHQMS